MEDSTPSPGRAPTESTFVCLRVEVPSAALAERAVAEAHDAGASGAEERAGSAGGTVLLVYAPATAADAVRRALMEVPGARLRPGLGEPVPERDWSTAWREGLDRVRLGPRLAVRPPFVPAEPEPGVVELVIDPGQAFGTGHHASTRLALELLEQALGGVAAGARPSTSAPVRARVSGAAPAAGRPGDVLDVGTGSGILALSALALGAVRAVAFDLDPVAVAEAARNARANGLAERLALFAGPLAALEARGFPVVVANLLRRELLPLLPGIAERVAPGGCVVLSGLLVRDRPALEEALAAVGLAVRDRREARDGGERWLGLVCAPG